MGRTGWRELVKNWNWTRGEGHYPIAAYSEFMPAPWVGEKPYGTRPLEHPFSDAEPSNWRVSSTELTHELAPGFVSIGRQIIETLLALATEPEHTSSATRILSITHIGQGRSASRRRRFKTSATSSSRRSRSPRRRTTKAACAGRCSVEATKARQRDSGRASLWGPENFPPSVRSIFCGNFYPRHTAPHR